MGQRSEAATSTVYVIAHFLVSFPESCFWKIGCQNLVTRFNLHIKQVAVPKKAIWNCKLCRPSKTVDVGGASLSGLLQPHVPDQKDFWAVLWKGKKQREGNTLQVMTWSH